MMRRAKRIRTKHKVLLDLKAYDLIQQGSKVGSRVIEILEKGSSPKGFDVYLLDEEAPKTSRVFIPISNIIQADY